MRPGGRRVGPAAVKREATTIRRRPVGCSGGVAVLVEKQTQLLFVPDDGPVEEFVAQGANPSLGERVRLLCPWRDPKCGDASSGEHGVERASELPCSVTDEVREAVIDGRPRRAWSITEASRARIVRSISLNFGRLVWRCSTRT